MRKILYFIIGVGCWMLASCTETVSDARQEAEQPRIYPDYLGVTIPVNIAPLCFNMADETALCIDAVITDSHGNSLHSQGEESVDFDIDDWHALLSQNSGDSLSVVVSAKYDDGWHTYRPFSIYVSADSIDYGICYRLIEPGYEVWSKMGIYERDLSSFDERALIENTQFEGCVNCHSFNRGNPKDMSLHIRGPHGATLLRQDNSPMTAYNTKTDQTLGLCVYPYWHPSGRYIAYSTNTTRQLFHSADSNRIEAYIKPQDWEISKTRKHRNDSGRISNMRYVEDGDYFICRNNRKLTFSGARIRKDHAEPIRTYECRWGCVSCPYRKSCIRSPKKNRYRKFDVMIRHHLNRCLAYERLSSDFGAEVRANRSIQVQGKQEYSG